MLPWYIPQIGEKLNSLTVPKFRNLYEEIKILIFVSGNLNC